MMRALNIAATGLYVHETSVTVISENLANIRTPGFKQRRPEFTDLLYQNMRRAGTNSADDGTVAAVGMQIGLGARARAIYRNHNQGALESTEGTLDLAIDGNGFFQIQLPSGETAFTRAGNFQLSEDGEIVTSDGFTVNPGVSIPQDATSISINSNGEVLVKIDGQTDEQNLGQVEMARFLNAAGLSAIGNNLYLETAASGSPLTGNAGSDGFGSLLQGFIENSNINAVAEITNLIAAQRAYEMNTRVLSATDEMLQSLNQSA